MALTDDPNFELWHQASRPGAEIDKITPRFRFFFHLGYAINLWSYIDREMFEIFYSILEIRSKEHAATLFYKSPSINNHFSMTASLIKSKSSLSSEAAALWDIIVRGFNKSIRVRNRLAHDPVTQIVHAVGTVGSRPLSQEIVSQIPPPSYQLQIERNKMLKASKPEDTSPITLETITKHITVVSKLEDDLRRLRKLL
jgi:hypothetical protein